MTDPLLLDIPDSFETERLVLRAPRPGDGTAINVAIRESFAELQPWMPWAQSIPSVSESEAIARRHAALWMQREELVLLLWRKDDGMFVGSSGLHHINWEVPRMEIGYWVRTGLTHQGYMTEAVRGITRFALRTLSAERIEIRCDAANTRSAAVAERAGYTLEARLHHHRRNVAGELTDTLLYVMFANGLNDR